MQQWSEYAESHSRELGMASQLSFEHPYQTPTLEDRSEPMVVEDYVSDEPPAPWQTLAEYLGHPVPTVSAPSGSKTPSVAAAQPRRRDRRLGCGRPARRRTSRSTSRAGPSDDPDLPPLAPVALGGWRA